ncbi:hypothetical protein [Streptomyces lomondensis]|uniref:Uncharacterized protein n=1 Tax=Streptomyces lomondensis TaxID=68229 RepID=A0ABQ2WVS7_9ACTN|nr:hypothetical protein [Streptomyces lomondensis]MCF0078787.1 hypothetical protein [Streptomyces lomondensis]GGW82183.1 hypothetical protein GCM10010383_07970 [Streptomyces lomondensis]
MTDMTRPPGDGTPAPDARGETALGTGHGTDRTTGAPTPGVPAEDRLGTAGTPHTAGRTGPHEGGSREAGSREGGGSHLLPHDESDKLGSQLQHAVAGFVDGPRAAVEEADHVLEEIAARFTEAVTQRRRTLRHSWQSVEGGEGKPVSSADTEQLRLALKDYRELAERLLHV